MTEFLKREISKLEKENKELKMIFHSIWYMFITYTVKEVVPKINLFV